MCRRLVNCSKEEAVACEECSGLGWMLCDFCKGKKNNVKSEGTRVYRRCPTCKAVSNSALPRSLACRIFLNFDEHSPSHACRRASSCAQDAGCTSASPSPRAMNRERVMVVALVRCRSCLQKKSV